MKTIGKRHDGITTMGRRPHSLALVPLLSTTQGALHICTVEMRVQEHCVQGPGAFLFSAIWLRSYSTFLETICTGSYVSQRLSETNTAVLNLKGCGVLSISGWTFLSSTFFSVHLYCRRKDIPVQSPLQNIALLGQRCTKPRRHAAKNTEPNRKVQSALRRLQPFVDECALYHPMLLHKKIQG